jgi:hypothetical protein
MAQHRNVTVSLVDGFKSEIYNCAATQPSNSRQRSLDRDFILIHLALTENSSKAPSLAQ